MKIVVIGAGAMGSLYGGLLKEQGNDVVLVDVFKQHIEAINNSGLILEMEKGKRVIAIEAKYASEVKEAPDLAIVFTKTIHTESALASVRAFLGENTYVLTLQNGLGNVELIEKYVPQDRIIVGVTNFPSDLIGPGSIRSLGTGETIIMSAGGVVSARLLEVETMMNEAGLHCKISPGVFEHIWEKVAFNAAINTLTSVTKLRIGDMAGTEEGRNLVYDIVNEVISVANKRGIAADKNTVVKNVLRVFEEHADHMPSMMQDVLAHRATEVESINGAVVREAQALGMDVPVTRVFYQLICIMQKTYDRQVSI